MHQMLDRDCPPSTAMHAPLTRLACCEQTNATTVATSSTVPKRPSGISRRDEARRSPQGPPSARRCHPPPSHRIEPGATALTVTPSQATSRPSDVDEADLGRLGGVVGGRAAGLAAPDRRDDDDAAPAALAPCPGRTSWVIRTLDGDVALRTPASNSAGPVSLHELPARRPRLLTRMSIGPSALLGLARRRARQPSSVSRSATTPSAAERRRRPLDVLLGARGDRDADAFGGQRLCDAEPDSARARP